MSTRPGIDDPDDWLGYWLSLHPSELFPGKLAEFAVALLEQSPLQDGPGYEVIRFAESGQSFEVHVNHVVEQFPQGRIFHVLSIASEGDPLPPVVGS